MRTCVCARVCVYVSVYVSVSARERRQQVRANESLHTKWLREISGRRRVVIVDVTKRREALIYQSGR